MVLRGGDGGGGARVPRALPRRGRGRCESSATTADFSLASVPEVVDAIRPEVELVDAAPPDDAPDWVRDVVAEHGGGFRDFAETSRSAVLRAAYYLGASFVTTYPVLRWELGAGPAAGGAPAGGDRASRRARTWRPCAAPRRCWPAATPPQPWRAGATPSRASRWRTSAPPRPCPASPPRPRSSGTTRSAGRPGSTASATCVKLEGEWPARGRAVGVESRPGGRGRVVERVTAYEARIGQTLAVEDEQLRGDAAGLLRARARTGSRWRSSSSTSSRTATCSRR